MSPNLAISLVRFTQSGGKEPEASVKLPSMTTTCLPPEPPGSLILKTCRSGGIGTLCDQLILISPDIRYAVYQCTAQPPASLACRGSASLPNRSDSLDRWLSGTSRGFEAGNPYAVRFSAWIILSFTWQQGVSGRSPASRGPGSAVPSASPASGTSVRAGRGAPPRSVSASPYPRAAS